MYRLNLVVVLTLILGGCANLRDQPDATELTENWAFTGKMAVRNADEASSFNVDWQQRAQAFEIELSGPLGQGAVSIEGEPGHVVLRRGKEVIQAQSLRQLAYEVTNLNLPLDYLQFWVRARPNPAEPADLERDSQSGQAVRIEQSGWNVTFPAYYGEGESALPRRIDFERNEASGRLVIRNWIIEG